MRNVDPGKGDQGPRRVACASKAVCVWPWEKGAGRADGRHRADIGNLTEVLATSSQFTEHGLKPQTPVFKALNQSNLVPLNPLPQTGCCGQLSRGD